MDKSRRDFLKKTGLAASGVLIGKSAISHASDDDEKMTIKKVRPLGFQWETHDPFLFCVHHEDFFPKGNDDLGPADSLAGRNLGQDFIIKDGYRMYHGRKVPGFPGHPHRGFETITVVRDGYVDHSDSLGGKARYGHGDLQWMTAGKGIQHSEMFPLLHKDKDNRMELFQIWLNLPRKNKMVDPYYKMNWSEDIPVMEHKDSNGKQVRVEVLAGSWGESVAPKSTPDSWAADPKNCVGIYAIKLEAGATLTLPATEEGVNRSLYFFEGEEVSFNGTDIPKYHAADVIPTDSIQIVNGKTESQILVLQGKPINEPVVQHGPFVMNTREEIQQAFMDYQKTGFGGWPYNIPDPVHGKEAKRFAIHTDGTREDRVNGKTIVEKG